MKKNYIIAGLSCMIVGAFLYLVNWDKFEFLAGHTTIKLYPAAFFFLAGLVIIARSLLRKNAAK